MKQVQKVWEQLASQKVELSVVKDILELKKLVDRMPSSMNMGQEVERAYDLVLQAQKEANRQLQIARSIDSEFQSLQKQLRSAADTLGVDVSEIGIGVSGAIEDIQSFLVYEVEMYEAIAEEAKPALSALGRMIP